MEALQVEVVTGSAREGPMTWGQLTQQAIYDFTGEESHRQTQKRSIELPPGLPPERIAAAVRHVLQRHESLRTLYSADRRQRVPAVLQLSVPMAAAGSAEQDRAIRAELHRRPFGPDDPPVRFGVLRRSDGSATLLVAASHVAVDAFAADRLADELEQLCCLGDPGALPPVVGQPMDRIDFEGSPAGRELSRRNIERWLRLRDDGVSSTPAPARTGTVPRFYTGTLTSVRLRRALPVAAARLRVSPAVLLLAGMSSALGELFGIAKVATRIAFSNRTGPEDQGIEALMQWGLAIVDVRAPAQEVARAAFRETMRASATARYDIYELFETLSGERHPTHQRFMPQAFLNYFDGASTTSMTPADGDLAAPESTFTTALSHEHDSDGLYFLFALPQAEAVTLLYMADSQLLTPVELEASARSLERWVLTAAQAGR
ncbi:condensation domain-containing protein [Dactylosporangium matsuzakiense]|uniref:Condensation domain-containing protein n=1 Tax=Dactylosporangium matsuzakiense TaxID=53360 RepID=A0A9W6KDB3_9ACTN|nr:condensation domain-containing protein [Dactylosporangium matsuzakiense]GLK99162.1 hypothetical protein GCM10017581_009030 [Dactylosporangium matsuzakiense]